MVFHESMNGNFAYIDNQNLYMATRNAPSPWTVDMRRFRVYLKEKYNVVTAYLFMGAYDGSHADLYKTFQEMGYVLMFREHGIELKGRKKGNVDVDIVFEVMRDAYNSAQMDKVVLVSGDGDYFSLVDHLYWNQKLERVLLPSKHNASSLYKKLPESHKAYLDDEGTKRKIGKK